MTSPSIEKFKTDLTYEISRTDDFNLLYKTYYTITSPRLETSVRDLFLSRELKTDTSDFSYFMDRILPLNGLSVSDNLTFLKRMTDGDLIQKDYLETSDNQVQNLRNLTDPILNDVVLQKMVDHKAECLSSSSVGRGEFAFVLLTGGSTKPQKGGDLRIGDQEVEVKAKGAKMASQTSHLAFSSIASEVQKYLGEGVEIKNLTKKNLENYYLPLLGSFSKLLEFLRFVFSKTMYQGADFSWLDECQSVDDFFKKLAIQEFTYYQKCSTFDRILFLNPDNLNVYSTSRMDEERIKNFSLKQSFAFKTERIQTNYWILK